MKMILDGQKNLTKEINYLKQKQQIDKKFNVEPINSFMRDQPSPLDASIDKVAVSKEKSNKKASVNQSILIRESGQSKQGKISKQKKMRQRKQFDFDDHLEDLRTRGKNGERTQVSEEWKARIWAEVEGRVK